MSLVESLFDRSSIRPQNDPIHTGWPHLGGKWHKNERLGESGLRNLAFGRDFWLVLYVATQFSRASSPEIRPARNEEYDQLVSWPLHESSVAATQGSHAGQSSAHQDEGPRFWN